MLGLSSLSLLLCLPLFVGAGAALGGRRRAGPGEQPAAPVLLLPLLLLLLLLLELRGRRVEGMGFWIHIEGPACAKTPLLLYI